MRQLRLVLGNRPLRRVLMAQVPADFADWLDYLAVAALLAFSWNEGPLVLAWLAVALGAPYVFVGPFAGALVDRMPIVRILIASNLGRAAMTASLALAPGWQTLLVLVFLRNSVDAFFTPAKQAAIQATTGPEDRLAANGLSHGINQASKIVAPALGAGLLVVLDPSEIFIVNAFVSLAAAVLLVGSKPIERQGPDNEEPSRSVLDGLTVNENGEVVAPDGTKYNARDLVVGADRLRGGSAAARLLISEARVLERGPGAGVPGFTPHSGVGLRAG